MRKLLAIGVSLFLLCGLGGKSEKVTLFPTQVLPQRYTHLIETSQSQTFEPYLRANLIAGLPYRLSYQIAGVHFILDSVDDEVQFDYVGLCSQIGYGVLASSCGEGMAGNSCYYSTEYVDGCLTPEEWCVKNGYSITENDCKIPEYPDLVCPKNENLFKNCLQDNEKACNDSGYFLTCETGKVSDTSSSCPYDVNYKTCVCDPCKGYDFTADEATEQGYDILGAACNSCGEMKYMRQAHDCGSYVECECGGIGEVCWSGSKKMFASCKDCYVPCPAGQLDFNYYWCGGALRCMIK